jgi:hypothetical protein
MKKNFFSLVATFVAVTIFSLTSCKKCPLEGDGSGNNKTQKVIISPSPNTPVAGYVTVNNTANTNGIVLLRFNEKVTSKDGVNKKIPIHISSQGATVSKIVNIVKLYRGPNLIDAIDGSLGYAIATDGSITNNPVPTTGSNETGYIFNNISSPSGNILADSTVEFTIVVDVKSANGNYPDLSSLKVSIANPDVLLPANLSILNNNGDQIPAGPNYRSGEAIGFSQTLQLNCLQVIMGTSTYTNTVDVSGNITSVTYTIPITVTTCNTIYIGQSAQYNSVTTGTNSFSFAFNNSAAPTVDDLSCGENHTLSSSDAVIQGSAFRLDAGTTKHFQLTVVLSTPSVLNSQYRVHLKQLKTFTDGLLTTGAVSVNLIPASSFQTEYRLINN